MNNVPVHDMRQSSRAAERPAGAVQLAVCRVAASGHRVDYAADRRPAVLGRDARRAQSDLHPGAAGRHRDVHTEPPAADTATQS